MDENMEIQRDSGMPQATVRAWYSFLILLISSKELRNSKTKRKNEKEMTHNKGGRKSTIEYEASSSVSISTLGLKWKKKSCCSLSWCSQVVFRVLDMTCQFWALSLQNNHNYLHGPHTFHPLAWFPCPDLDMARLARFKSKEKFPSQIPSNLWQSVLGAAFHVQEKSSLSGFRCRS